MTLAECRSTVFAFMAALRTGALLHRQLASAETSRQSCRGESNDKKCALLHFPQDRYIFTYVTTEQ